MPKIIDYYFTPSSPWTYLGHARFVALAARHGAGVQVKPVDLGGRIFPVSGGVPVARRSTQRQAYRLVELSRWSRYLSIPLNVRPQFFPVDASLAAHVIIAADLAHGVDAALRISGRIMEALWAKDGNIADRDTLQSIVAGEGFDANALLANAGNGDVHSRFERYTEEAIARNVYFYLDEPFWGQDRLEFLDRALADS